jgi:type I restriction-modification system DNA methylase subunit
LKTTWWIAWFLCLRNCFYNTQIPACLWFLARNKTNGKFRNRSNEILFIDARELGTMISRKQKELTDKDIAKISDTYHNWRSKADLKNHTKTLRAFVNRQTYKKYERTITFLLRADTLILKKPKKMDRHLLKR